MANYDLKGRARALATSVSGYGTTATKDPKADTGNNFAGGLGCTISGFTACYRVESVEDAIAVRVAAKMGLNWYATYVIATMTMEKGPHSYYGDNIKNLNYFKAAGWKVLVKMEGAHGSYYTVLLGAPTLSQIKAQALIGELEPVEKEKPKTKAKSGSLKD